MSLAISLGIAFSLPLIGACIRLEAIKRLGVINVMIN